MKKFKKAEVIILSTIFVFFIASIILSIPFAVGDEFINYQNAYKIFNGEIIYKDVNVLSTPLLFYIAILFFKLLGPSLIIFRVYNICINITVAITIFKIFRNLKIKNMYSIIYTLLLEILIATFVVGNGPNYNILGLLMVLIGTNCYITRRKTKFNSIIQGIIIFLAMMTKQNIGIYYSLAYAIIEVILNRKKGLKEVIKTFCITIFGLILYMVYLISIGNLEGFISYTVLGIKDFTRNVFIEGIEFIIFDIIIISLMSIGLYKKKYKTECFENIIILFVFGLFMLPIAYPIADRWHIIVASMVLYIDGIYILQTSIIDDIKVKEKKLVYVILLIVCYMIITSVAATFKYVKNIYINKENKYNLISIENSRRLKIAIMESYITKSDKKVVIVSPEARII